MFKLHPALLTHVERLLVEVLKFRGPADVSVSRYFREHKQLGHRERGIVAEAVFAVLRNRMEFAQYAESGVGNQIRRLALLGFAATQGREAVVEWLDKVEKEWLERLASIDRKSLSPAIRANLPDWLMAEMEVRFPGEAGQADREALAEALLAPAPLDLRANQMKASREEVMAALTEAGEHVYAHQPTPFAPQGIRLKRKPALSKLPLFLDGRIEVQDEGSQLLCHLVAPKRGEMVVDFCAGAGGKTLALGALMRSTGRLYALDVNEKRLNNFKPRQAKSGLSNVHPILIDSENDVKVKRLAGKIDRVLVDAPCSGLGTLRRNPDLKWRQSPQAVAELNQKQAAILASASRLVKPGGRLVYATCSFIRSENQDIVEGFLATHPDFILKPAGEVLAEQKIDLPMGDWFELWPHRHHTDGFFAAVLERKAKPAVPKEAVVEASATEA